MTETPADAAETTRSRDGLVLPQGVADFADLRRMGAFYADKTGLLHSLVRYQAAYFLFRPRGFGKTLILSALENILLGRRELFEGLAIDGLRYDWEHHPVLRLDMKELGAETPEEIKDGLSRMLRAKALEEGIEPEGLHPGQTLTKTHRRPLSEEREKGQGGRSRRRLRGADVPVHRPAGGG